MAKSYKYLLYVVCFAILASAYFLVFSGESIPDNGNTANSIRTELGESKSELDRSDTSLGNIEQRIGRSEDILRELERINSHNADLIARIQERNRSCQSILEENRREIEQCQSIIRKVREGDQSEDKKLGTPK
ncbi:hypothetical protein [Bacteroides sp.]|uniref:hypothetical protein n=1 Tax=Bacteroides sp. TaxID=29523 RepID=UPI00262CC298|nr:hypothetical protein [Bacteroides sp.]MDD3039743.1 hypothetical protein [Bacteroides sp.]